jgi:hypothetical protein
MAKRLRSLYRWSGRPGDSVLELIGDISEARLRAWEYRASAEKPWAFVKGDFRDTVRQWRTARPDLRIPEMLWIGDREELASKTLRGSSEALTSPPPPRAASPPGNAR